MKLTLTKPNHTSYPFMSSIVPGDIAQIMNGAYEGQIGVCFRHIKDGPCFVIFNGEEYWTDLENKNSLQIRLLQPGETLTVSE